jgi:hypothetical protein
VLGLERRQGADHLSGLIAQRPVAADQIGVHVGQRDPRAGQPALGQQVEEDGAAPQERLDIAVEPRGVIRRKCR